jgi:Ca-activated chloride channel family protein
MLMEIASKGGGEYYRASSPGMGMNSILSKLRGMNKSETEFKVFTEYEEQFAVLIWLAFGILLLDLLLLERKNKWLKNVILFNRKK